MNAEQNKKIPDFVDKRSCVTKTKVSSYTQVESEFVGAEVRSIVGQEDFEDNYISKRLQDLSLRKQNKGIRPPLVGQASSSSNDSVSIFNEGKSDTEQLDQVSGRANSPYQVGLAEELGDHADVGLNRINFARGNYTSTPFLLNRDEYINQRPPEGSSGKPSMLIQPLENSQDFPRMRSQSSASSVTSSKPLEWDSGADVGYNQLYTLSGENLDPGISTIERMALACGTNLLTRSDPEGTTGQSGQPQPIAYKDIKSIKLKSKKKIGHPNAESTPMGTRVTSDVSPDTVSGDVISPINCEIVDTNLDSDKSSSLTGSSLPTNLSSKEKIPLFPELLNSLPATSNFESGEEAQKSKQRHLKNLGEQLAESNMSNKENGLQNERKVPCDNLKLRSKLKSVENEAILDTSSNSCNKKLSSSLENVSLVPAENKTNSNTLPRCQSQTNLNSDNVAIERFEGKNDNNFPKLSMALHSLIQYTNKSASSSSVATVVHKKGDSPKRVFSSNSAQQQESVGIQISNSKNGTNGNHKSSNLNKFNETPHLPKAVTQQMPKRSNYFNFDSLNEKQDLVNDSAKENELPSHSHDGIPCTGAHKKIPCLEILDSKSSRKQNNQAQVATDNFQSNASVNHRPDTQGFPSVNNIGQTKHLFGTGTIDSVESSAKSGGWTDKQYSVTVEDRVNSFEYLPGHIYENSERQPIIESRGTSSMSIQNQTSNNETPEEEGRIWDSSASATSTGNLERDVKRGVEIISDFVKGSCANNSLMKKKLIRRVVEKLITKNYNDDKIEHVDLKSNLPWVPSRPPNPLERNGRETRRSLNRSKVPCEFSSRSEKSGSTNASSDCFIPRPAASSTFLPSSLRETNGLPGQQPI